MSDLKFTLISFLGLCALCGFIMLCAYAGKRDFIQEICSKKEYDFCEVSYIRYKQKEFKE